MASEFDKMILGQYYYSFDPELIQLRERAHRICHQYNTSAIELTKDQRNQLLRALFGIGVAHLSDEEMPWIEPPFHCDYGTNIRFGKFVYFNFNCIILDCAPVTIGDNVLVGPSCRFYTAQHPLSPTLRQGTKGPEYAQPIHIDSDVWFGGDVMVLSNVHIAQGCTFGAGTLVNKSVNEKKVVVVGNPGRIVKRIQEEMEVLEFQTFQKDREKKDSETVKDSDSDSDSERQNNTGI
ncbi:hypothetical protein HMI54_009693 [Coelomomyces lativittatus]|nr:hypothetical protein HMI56_004891 [Coelomomyces lativittatus]KAJ1501775.1 hypothetical protein HMI54_009693 [Coelomomyces lativittatus]KAJ1508830.1 hypothetical protein HMI55_000210 [Coelomomyces lativittatus]